MEERKYTYNKIGEPEIDNLLDQVEKALGFQLFIWQRQYIYTGKKEWIGGRWTGKTTALILRELLIFTEDDEPLDLICPLTKRAQLYKEEMRKIQQKLDHFLIPTRKVWYDETDKIGSKSFEMDVTTLYPSFEHYLEKIGAFEDDVILRNLKAYGITKENLVHNLYRIQVFSFAETKQIECLKKLFLVDGEYAFTLCKTTNMKTDRTEIRCTVWVEKEENV